MCLEKKLSLISEYLYHISFHLVFFSFPLDDSPEQETSCHDGFNVSSHAVSQFFLENLILYRNWNVKCYYTIYFLIFQQSFHKGWSSEYTAARRKRIYQHFDDLEACYFNMKKGNVSGSLPCFCVVSQRVCLLSW
jgi:hypothetical protein